MVGVHIHKFLGNLYIKSNQRSTKHFTNGGGINTEMETKSQIKMEKHKRVRRKQNQKLIHLPGQRQVKLSRTRTHTHTNQTSKRKMVCSIRMIQISKSMDNICLVEDVGFIVNSLKRERQWNFYECYELHLSPNACQKFYIQFI